MTGGYRKNQEELDMTPVGCGLLSGECPDGERQALVCGRNNSGSGEA